MAGPTRSCLAAAVAGRGGRGCQRLRTLRGLRPSTAATSAAGRAVTAAAMVRHAAVVALLIDAGADVDLPGRRSQQPAARVRRDSATSRCCVEVLIVAKNPTRYGRLPRVSLREDAAHITIVGDRMPTTQLKVSVTSTSGVARTG